MIALFKQERLLLRETGACHHLHFQPYHHKGINNQPLLMHTFIPVFPLYFEVVKFLILFFFLTMKLCTLW